MHHGDTEGTEVHGDGDRKPGRIRIHRMEGLAGFRRKELRVRSVCAQIVVIFSSSSSRFRP